MAFEVRAERRGHVAVVTIDNPPVNALHPDVAAAIHDRCREAGEDPDVRAIVLTGAGEKHFMAGGDIKFIRTLDAFKAERYVFAVQEMQDQLGLLPQPVIAALNGTTLGGGLELAMACDIRIAEEHALFGQPEVSLGIIPGAGGTQNLPRLVPVGRAKKLLFTGERIGAEEALAIGLVEEVVPTRRVARARRRARRGDRPQRADGRRRRQAGGEPRPAGRARRRAPDRGLALRAAHRDRGLQGRHHGVLREAPSQYPRREVRR